MTSLTHYFTVFIAINLHEDTESFLGGGGGRVKIQSFDVNFIFQKEEKGSVPVFLRKPIP